MSSLHGGREIESRSVRRKGRKSPFFLPVHPTPAAQAINVEILALVTCR